MEETICPGYQFVPTDKQLITHYLCAKVNNQPLPYNGITECDLYGDKSPWEIFNEKEKRYVFTKLKKVGKKRVARTAGVGTWHGNNSGDDIFDVKTKNLIGIKKTFTFKVKPNKSKPVNVSKTEGNWIMHEFSLAGENCSDYVICRVEKKIKKKEKREDDDDDDDDDDGVEQVGDQRALSTCAANSVNEGQVPSTSVVASHHHYVVSSNEFDEVTTSNTFAAAYSVNEGQASSWSDNLFTFNDLDSLSEFLLGDDELPNLQEGDVSMQELVEFVDSLINIPQ